MSTHENRPYAKHHDYDCSSLSEEINLITDENGPSDGKGGRKPGPARRVAPFGAGTLALRYGDGSEEEHTVTSAQIGTALGIIDATFVQAILPATDIDWVRVGW